MLNTLMVKFGDPQFLMMVMAGIAAAATVLTIAMPLLQTDQLGKRMRAVAAERDQIRARERERLNRANDAKPTLRQQPKAYMKNVVDQFQLGKWLGTETAKQQLAMAGFRGPQAE